MKERRESVAEITVEELINRVEGADDKELKEIKEELTGNLKEDGGGNYVSLVMKLLEGEIDLEVPSNSWVSFKKIFAVNLPELERAMVRKEFSLPDNHPISSLFGDHERDVKKLKALKNDLKAGKDGFLTGLKNFYKKLDTHIFKEEESLFPKLEESGLSKIPENLRGEHKKFRGQLVRYFELLQSGDSVKANRARSEFEEDFLPAMSSHIFRESYVFYPAALQYIQEDSEWKMIERGFNAVDNLVY